LIRLVRANLDLLHAALAGDDSLARALVHDVVAGWATFTKALQLTRDALAADPGGAAWGTRFFLTDDPPELVGWGGFKGPPRNGVVELGYEIAEARQGRGLATAATRAMVAEAFADERVTAVIAHTLAERNASNRVLEKVGFQHEGDAQKDGEVVWRTGSTVRQAPDELLFARRDRRRRRCGTRVLRPRADAVPESDYPVKAGLRFGASNGRSRRRQGAASRHCCSRRKRLHAALERYDRRCRLGLR
jgi:[ribosomal protein S5]-alanine N-acetyltransferase